MKGGRKTAKEGFVKDKKDQRIDFVIH